MAGRTGRRRPMRLSILGAALALAPAVAMAGAADGVWKTASNDKGGYLLVTMAPCASNASLTCGTISKAFKATGEDPAYANLGKQIVMNMQADGASSFSGGTIWDPENDKTYNSKMTVSGDTLDVEGCITFFCSGQDWTRVN